MCTAVYYCISVFYDCVQYIMSILIFSIFKDVCVCVNFDGECAFC